MACAVAVAATTTSPHERMIAAPMPRILPASRYAGRTHASRISTMRLDFSSTTSSTTPVVIA